jgi:hypothetical protein
VGEANAELEALVDDDHEGEAGDVADERPDTDREGVEATGDDIDDGIVAVVDVVVGEQSPVCTVSGLGPDAALLLLLLRIGTVGEGDCLPTPTPTPTPESDPVRLVNV